MKFKNLIYVLVISLFLFNCSGSDSPADDNNNPPDPNPTPSGKVTYNADIKSIMTANCTSCHGNPQTNGAPFALTTYTEVKNRISSIISAINNTTNPMPQTGLMPQGTRDKVQQWLDDGLLEN